MKQKIHDLDFVKANVLIQVKDYNHKIIDQVALHNVLTDVGRKWFRDILILTSGSWTTGWESTGNLSSISNNLHENSNHRPALIGVGVGTQSESLQVTSLVSPWPFNKYKLTGSDTYTHFYRKPVLPHDSLQAQDIGELAPEGKSYIIYRTVFGRYEITFEGNKQLDPVQSQWEVPITEVGLYLSNVPLINADINEGLIAYASFPALTKTVLTYLDIVWVFDFMGSDH